ncbi:RipA family octameric membrane protein [Clostridium perfringens]|uniref:RipA family octameric membrane protein n=1 Tax=Clostridium perfringens TaxID=1502 RepID=UPI003BAC489A
MKSICEENIINIDENKRADIILEQWKVYVQMADNISNRREKSNKFFTTINTTIIGLCTTKIIDIDKKIIIITGILIGIVWILSIRSYKMLNKAKFQVINEIENKLPVQGFKYEWDKLKVVQHINLTSSEKYVPIAFIIIYIIFLCTI